MNQKPPNNSETMEHNDHGCCHSNAGEPSSLSASDCLLGAVASHFVAKRDRAMANLSNYMSSSAGVGEHPDVVEECIKLVEDIDHAESALETLRRI